jgi:hypothetical protein
MIRLRKFLPLGVAALVGAAVLGASTPARADFILRTTDVLSGGAVNGSITTGLAASNPDGSGSVTLSGVVGNFSISIVTHISTVGPGAQVASSDTINITYNGPTGASSDKLIIEVLANKFTNIALGSSSTITSNGSPSTSGLAATSVVMTSGVIAGNVVALGAAGTTLDSQLGMTTGTGTMGSASSVLNPNPVSDGAFGAPNPFSFYQTYTFMGFTNSAQAGSLSAGSTVSAVPEPGGIALALAGLSAMAGGGLLRRRKAVPSV